MARTARRAAMGDAGCGRGSAGRGMLGSFVVVAAGPGVGVDQKGPAGIVGITLGGAA